MDEGVIKYDCDWERSPALPDAVVQPLETWRTQLRARGLLGYDAAHGVGFGNLSARLAGLGIVISATQTGHLECLSGGHYVQLTEYDLAANRVRCRGAAQASSESLTHLAIYALDDAIGAVIHVHCAPLWHARRHRSPTTGKDVPYGTVAMARAFQRLYESSELRRVRLAVMGGHADGIVTFGRDLDQAGGVLWEHLAALEGR